MKGSGRETGRQHLSSAVALTAGVCICCPGFPATRQSRERLRRALPRHSGYWHKLAAHHRRMDCRCQRLRGALQRSVTWFRDGTPLTIPAGRSAHKGDPRKTNSWDSAASVCRCPTVGWRSAIPQLRIKPAYIKARSRAQGLHPLQGARPNCRRSRKEDGLYVILDNHGSRQLANTSSRHSGIPVRFPGLDRVIGRLYWRR